MDKKYWTDYAKYLVLVDKSNDRLQATYDAFLRFKKVKEVINSIAHADKSNYLFEDNIYNRKITSADAKIILDNISECKWTDKTGLMLLVANQLKLRI